MKKSLSYVLIVLGLIILAIGVKPVNEKVVQNVPQLQTISQNILMIAGVVVLVLGVVVFRFFSGSSKQPSEVPIYHGKNVVGFRRMGKR